MFASITSPKIRRFIVPLSTFIVLDCLTRLDSFGPSNFLQPEIARDILCNQMYSLQAFFPFVVIMKHMPKQSNDGKNK